MQEHATAINAAVVALLKSARTEQGLSMEELADRAGVHRTYVGLLERGDRQPTLVSVASLANALDLSLSELLTKAEELAAKGADTDLADVSYERRARPECLESDERLGSETGMRGKVILAAIDDTYRTLDLLDGQLAEAGSPPFALLVELANLSSMLGNIVGAAIARHSKGHYVRSGPHKYQDLRSTDGGKHVEIKTALENNKPKGHLSKAGLYLTFRYVLADRTGEYQRGERGDTAFLWEVRFGNLAKTDFDESNTPGDSGKTAVIKTNVLKGIERVYFDPEFFPYAQLDGPWGKH